MSNASKLAGAFVGIVALVVLVAAVSPLLGASTGSEARTAANASTLDSATNLVDVPSENGTVTTDSDGESKVIVIDRAHANGFTREELQPLVQSLVEAGHEVRFHGSGSQQGRAPELNASLRGADAFVVVAPRQPYRAPEVRGVADFADRGGRVLLVAEPASTQVSGGLLGGLSAQRVSTELTALSSQFGMSVGTGYLYNMHDNANNFQHVYATPSGGTNLTDGVDRAVFQRVTPVAANNGTAETLLTATDRTHLSTTRSNEAYGVAARNGNATVIGDSTFLEPSYYRDADNEVLIGNVIEFLTGGDKQPKPEPEEPTTPNGGTGEFTPPSGETAP
ncbi:DUF4350 domain-containing protein [Halorientalis salina]|uniref:DUF4350 domain-containing protein n=1 Tax=Halorientalis salina TaxID=2932266 RepID=UPI0010ACDB90|nr:DUF4350 domain-containing protein [Halorientalis salina]